MAHTKVVRGPKVILGRPRKGGGRVVVRKEPIKGGGKLYVKKKPTKTRTKSRRRK